MEGTFMENFVNYEFSPNPNKIEKINYFLTLT
jgi:hypothetical protein